MPRLPALLLVPALCTACAAIPADEAALMSDRISCDDVDGRIARLEAARPDDLRRARLLLSSLTPGGFALGVITNDMGDRERILSGGYEAQIDERIAEIRTTCDLPAPEASRS